LFKTKFSSMIMLVEGFKQSSSLNTETLGSNLISCERVFQYSRLEEILVSPESLYRHNKITSRWMIYQDKLINLHSYVEFKIVVAKIILR
jgi:hypothetical protein